MTTASVQPELLPVGPVEVQRLDTREAWLEARRQGIGGSDAPAVVGVSPFKSALQLYAEKLGLADPDPGESEAMQWGLLLEPVLAEHYQRLVPARRVERAPLTLLRSRRHPFMVLSPDGFVTDPQRGVGLIEFKTASAYRADDWADEPPLAYQVQVQHGMAVAEVSWAVLAVLIGGQTFRAYEITRNDAFLAALVEHERRFWHRLLEKEPPPIDGSESAKEMLRRLYPKETPGLVVNLPPECVEWDAELEAVKAEERRVREQKELLENRIKAALGDAEAGVLQTGVTYTWRASERKAYTVPAATVRTLRRKESRA